MHAKSSKKEQLKEIEIRLQHEKNRRMYERYQAIRLHLMGHSYEQISNILGRCKFIHIYITNEF